MGSTASSDEHTPLLSEPMSSINNNTVSKEKDILFKKWWSSFDLLDAPRLHWVLLLSSIVTIFYYPLKLIVDEYVYNKKPFDAVANIIDIHRFIVSVIIVIGCYYLKFGKIFRDIYQELYRKNETTINKINQLTCWQSFKFFLANIHYNWIYVFLLSGFFSFIVPLIHPDMGHKPMDYLIPGLYPNCISNLVRFYFVQQFWIACHLMHKVNNEFKMTIESQKSIEGMANLEENKQHHKRIRSLITYIDDRMKYLVLIFYFASIVGTLIPIIQIWQLFSHDELSTQHKIALPVIIIASVYVLGYSLYKAFMIPLEYENAIELYYLNVGYVEFRNREKGFHEEFKLAKENVFSKIPSLTFGGIFSLSIGFATYTVLLQLVPAVFALIKLIPYHSVNGTTTSY